MKIIFNKRKILIALLIVWIALWVHVTIRDLIKKKYLKQYMALLSRDSPGRASYTYGDELFGLLKLAKESLPQAATYDIIGLEYLSIDERRAIYYLYPCIRTKNNQYLLVFNADNYAKKDYEPFKELDSARYILKRIK